jgi:hypothetical protein
VWQLAFGSGFKFNSAVLQANRRVQDHHAAWDNFEALVSLGGFGCILLSLSSVQQGC